MSAESCAQSPTATRLFQYLVIFHLNFSVYSSTLLSAFNFSTHNKNHIIDLFWLVTCTSSFYDSVLLLTISPYSHLPFLSLRGNGYSYCYLPRHEVNAAGNILMLGTVHGICMVSGICIAVCPSLCLSAQVCYA